MTQNFRQLKNRIKTVENTRKITRAMQMVSAAKLNKAKTSFFAAKPYFADLQKTFFDLLSDVGTAGSPLLEARDKKDAIALMVIGSDTGLCSAYNNNVIRLAQVFIEKYGREKVRVIPVGKEAFSHFKREGYNVENPYIGLSGKFSKDVANDMANTMTSMFVDGTIDEAYTAYTNFSPSLRHKPVVEKFLGIEYERKPQNYYILEPDRQMILTEMASKYLVTRMSLILLDSFTSEHSARMLAMKLATDNADELIETLTLLKNKARQASITKEVLEIATSAEALRS